MVNKYSLSNDRRKKLSKNFTVGEFACRDKSDLILVDSKLVLLLQKLRNAVCEPVIINSAYRTKAHNSCVGGAPNQHKKKRRMPLRAFLLRSLVRGGKKIEI